MYSMIGLADKMREDIRFRGLRPGDVYLTADEAARRLSVSKADANRALQLLASKRLISRRQGHAPRLLQGVARNGRGIIDKVHILIPEADIKSEGLYSDGVMIGLQSALQGSQIQLNFLPERGEAGYVSRLVDEALSATRLEAFVLVRSTLEAQQAVAASGLPAIVNGTCYPSLSGLSSMDRDHVLSARLHIEYLAQVACNRVLVLMRDRIYPGDQIFFDALVAEYTGHPEFTDQPAMRFLPNDEGMVLTTMSNAVEREGGKLGIIVRSMALAAKAVSVAEQLGLHVPTELAITVCDYHPTGPGKALELPHEIDAEWSPQRIGEGIAVALLNQARGEADAPNHVRYDTKFICPTAGGLEKPVVKPDSVVSEDK